MAHGWDSYYHNQSSDARTLTRTSESEGRFSQHIENFIEHHDFNDTVASHETPATTSNFNANCYSNPGIGNTSSDCVYERYYTESPWQADGEQIEKDFLPRCGNGDMSDFATDGLLTSGCFSSSFATDLHEIKQDCGMLTTPFLEDYSDVSSCLDTDAEETRPSCKFMENNSVQKPETDSTTKHSLPEWLFSHPGNAVFPTESLPTNMAHTNVSSPGASNLKMVKCSQDDMKNPEKIIASSTGHDLSSTASNMVTTTGNETVKDRNNSDGCEDPKEKEDVKKDFTQGKRLDIISDHKNLTDGGIEQNPLINEEVQITAMPSNVITTFYTEKEHFYEKDLRKEIEKTCNQENEDFDMESKNGVQVRTMTDDQQDKAQVLKGERKESGPVDEQKLPNHKSVDGQHKTMGNDCEGMIGANCKLTKCTITLKNRNVSGLHFHKTVAHTNSCGKSIVMFDHHLGDGTNAILANDWTSTEKQTNSTSSQNMDCNGSGVTSERISTDVGDKKRECVADHQEFNLQTKGSSTDVNLRLGKELTDETGSNLTSFTDPQCSGLPVIGGSNEPGVLSHVASRLKTQRSNIETKPFLEKEILDRKTSSTFTDPNYRCSGVINDSLSNDNNDKNKRSIADDPELDLQMDSSKALLIDPNYSGCGDTGHSLFTDTSDKNKLNVFTHPEFDLQKDSLNTGTNPGLESTEQRTMTLSPDCSGCLYPNKEVIDPKESTNQCSGPIVASDDNSVSSDVKSCLGYNPNISPCLDKEMINPLERDTTALATENTTHQPVLDKNPVDLKPQEPDVEIMENARESFEELDASTEGQLGFGMLYGEPLSREDSSCDTVETPLDTSQYKGTSEAKSNGNGTEISEGQPYQLNTFRQMRKIFQPVVILKALESVNQMNDSYYCADCKHTTNSISNLIEHHHCCHSVHNFQFCKTCNVYMMRTDQAEEHLCGVTTESPPISSDSNLRKTRCQGRHKCDRCGLVFSKIVLYIRHMRTHTGKTPYKCKKCGLYFAQSCTLQRHLRIPGRCKQVHPSASTPATVTNKKQPPPEKELIQNKQCANLPDCYVRLVDISKTNYCRLCGKGFLTAEKTKMHFCNIHKRKSSAVSPNQFSTKPNGEKISKEENETRVKYKCPLCPRLFKYSYNRARHLRDCVRELICGGKEKVDGKYQCPLCYGTFTFPSNRYRHIKVICLRQFLNQLAKQKGEKSGEEVEQKKNEEVELKENEQIKHSLVAGADPKIIRRYKCNLCPAAFSHPSGKYKHMKKHELFKLTGKMFKYRHSVFSTMSKPADLTRINNENSEDNATSADANGSISLSCHFCGKCFTTSQSLKKHEHNHRGERPFCCQDCGKGFKKHAHLICHRIVHQRRIQCTVCKKILPSIGELIQHRKSHLKRGMLQCPDCDLQFQYPAYLLRHLDAHKNRENKAPQLEGSAPLRPQKPSETIKEHSVPNQLQCSLCKEVFDDAQVLRKHCLTHISGSSSHQCPFCKRKFSTRRYLLRHMNKHTGDKPYSCENCGKQFYRDLYLKLHNERCFPAQTRVHVTVESGTKAKRPYHCSYCPRSFCKKIRLKNHHHGHKVNSLVLCSRCGQYFGFRKLNQHQKNCAGAPDPMADSHNDNFNKSTSQTKLDAYKMPLQFSKTNMFEFKCPHCTQKFRYRSLLLRHSVSHTGVQPYACMYCGHRFSSLTMCSQHETSCEGVHKDGSSEVQSDASTELSSLSETTCITQAEGEAEYKCKFCTKTFMKSRNLRHHILTHNEVKPYRCKACDSCFSRYDHLKVHQARCKGRKTWLEIRIPKISLDDVGRGWQSKYGIEPIKKEETFECKVCVRSFSTESNLSRHITMFHVAKLFKCTRCDSAFAHEKSLKKHRKMNKCRRVSNEANASLPQEPTPTENLTKPLHGVQSRILQRIKPCFNKKFKYVCSYCPRAFANSWQLGVHTRLHTGEKPFACDYCGQRFIRKDYVQRHFAKCTKKPLQKQVLCDRCGGFFSEVKLENHKKLCTASPNVSKSMACQGQQSASQSPPKGFSCAYCNSRFVLFSQLQEHFLNAHKLETMAPPMSTVSLQHHLSNIPNVKEEPLDVTCDERRSDGANSNCNLNTALNSKITYRFFCPECKVPFANKSALIAHLRGHEMDYPFNCKTCKKGFWNKALLRNHHRKCRFSPTSDGNASEVPLKAEIDFAVKNTVLVFKEDSTATGTGVLQTNFSCKDDSTNESPQSSGEALGQSNSDKEKKVVQYQCSECDKSFTDGLLLISHLEDHGRQEQEKKRNTCSKCGRMCASQGHLENHMKIHGTDKKYPCPDCSKMVDTTSDLEIHRICHDQNRPFACKLCNQRFWTRPSLCNHYNEDHPNDVFSCRFCNKTYSVKKSLQRHYKKWHQKEQKDMGNTVQERGSSEQQYTSQISTTGDSDMDENRGSEDSDSDSAPYFPCHVCGKTFPTSESLEDHQLCHLGEKPHECEECGKCFFQASQLQQHQRMHKSEFQCQMCGRGFMSFFALRKHKHTHGKNRPYRCSKCHLYFTGPSQLAEHMSSHREENFPCDICNRVFHSKSSRAEHRKNHSKSGDQYPASFSRAEHEKSPSLSESSLAISKELKYRCGVCSERYKDPEELSEHGCMATKERLYSCSGCDKHFLHASHLKKHRTNHHLSWSNREYPCNKCNNSFSSSQHFLSHLKTHSDTAEGVKLNMENKDKGPSHGFICPVCHQCYDSASQLTSHFLTHPDRTFECKVCNMTFQSRIKLDEHKQCHVSSATEFECTQCGQSFLESDAFHQHDCSHQQHATMGTKNTKTSDKLPPPTYLAGEEEEIDVTGEDLYNCPLCSMQFSSKSSFLEHQNKVHLTKTFFKCELCGKAFTLRRYLKEHERKHRIKLIPEKTSQSPKEQLKCTQCHNQFNTAQDLSEHMRMHAEQNVGQYRCDMCYKSFSKLQFLKLHQESHVGEVVYECTECDKAFAFPHLLEEHQQAHAGSSH